MGNTSFKHISWKLSKKTLSEHKMSDSAVNLKPEIADEIERILDAGRAPLFNVSQILMGFTRERFGVSMQSFNNLADPDYTRAIRNCETCKNVNHCWHALRTGNDSETWNEFCPNADTFEKLSES